MRVSGLVAALGLSAVEMVAAGVCRPGSTTLSSEPASATEASSSTDTASTGVSSTILSILTEASSAASTEASSTLSTEASLTTISVSTDTATTLSVSTTSAVETTSTTVAATSTTSAGPPPIPTFNVVASGGGAAAGTRLSSSYRAPFITFGYEAGGASNEYFFIEPETGRLRTSNPDTYVCATYADNNQPAGTGRLINCIQQNIDVGADYTAYLTCGLSGGKVTCTAPLHNCYRQDFEWYCERDASGATVGTLFVYPRSAWGYSVGIGREAPNNFPEVQWNALLI
ncbi:hypothetical protein N0V84_007495 [Fusarium piperis]|uniref:Uncharacterized protein n=1 Tax=Fusarium piperis TaxID=1435070 RepID=A0A9W8WA19_9HYPO|nr:hypothetical protein N0V84_007495 [Fusarium piperis]